MGEPTGKDPMVEFEEMIAKDYSFNGFPKLLNNPAFSDLTLHVGNPSKEYRVHRNILCERSSYFATVCNGNFQESQTREINLPEQSPLVFEILLKYLYTGHFDDKDSPLEIIDTLLEAADYFDIENFKELVVQKVWKKLHDDSSSGATDRVKILDVGYLSGLFGELCKISFDERKIAILAKAFLKKGNLEQWLRDQRFRRLLDEHGLLGRIILEIQLERIPTISTLRIQCTTCSAARGLSKLSGGVHRIYLECDHWQMSPLIL